MSSREEFEAWASSPAFGLSPGHFAKDEQGEYINYPAHCYWLAWEASRHMLEVELPAYRPASPLAENKAYNYALDKCVTAIETAGVRVKP